MKTKFSVVFASVVFVLAVFVGSSFAAAGTSYIDVSAAEAKALIDKTPDIIIIDVSPVYAKGHLPGRSTTPSVMDPSTGPSRP